MKGYVEDRRRDGARGPFWGAHTATVPGCVGPPLLALRHPLVSIFCPKCFFSMKNDVVFFPDFISCKNSQGRDFAKNSIRNSSFIQIWKDPGANYDAKCLEKWMYLVCISSPKLSSLFVLKQLKRSAEVIKTKFNEDNLMIVDEEEGMSWALMHPKCIHFSKHFAS